MITYNCHLRDDLLFEKLSRFPVWRLEMQIKTAMRKNGYGDHLDPSKHRPIMESGAIPFQVIVAGIDEILRGRLGWKEPFAKALMDEPSSVRLKAVYLEQARGKLRHLQYNYHLFLQFKTLGKKEEQLLSIWITADPGGKVYAGDSGVSISTYSSSSKG